MRAVSLSNTEVIGLLNRFFIPVYLSNEDYARGGAAPPAEKAELDRVRREGHAAKLSVGSVHAYILAPDGRLLDSLHTAQAANAGKLIAMLERNVRALGTQGGPPVAAPTTLPRPRPARLTRCACT